MLNPCPQHNSHLKKSFLSLKIIQHTCTSVSVYEHACAYMAEFQVRESLFLKDRKVRNLNSGKTLPR